MSKLRESELPCNLPLNEETLEQNRIGLRCLANLLLKMKHPRNLLPYLDVYSIASLASIHQPTIRILKKGWGDSFMSKRIRESGLPCNLQLNKETVEQNRIGLHCLANLLLKMKKPRKLLLHLLEMICERCPPPLLANTVKSVQVSCPATGQCVMCLTDMPHLVSALGFVLLEEVEAVFGSVEQHVEKILLHNLVEPWLTALGSRVSRQEEMMKEFKMKNV